MTISLIITAGGTSSRYGKNNKLLEKFNGKTVIEYCVEKFLNFDEIFEIIISSNVEIKSILKSIYVSGKVLSMTYAQLLVLRVPDIPCVLSCFSHV